MVTPTPKTKATPAPKHTAATASSRLLVYGLTGNDVKEVQARLGVRADGIFGRATRRAVENFQSKHNLTQDGIVGPLTKKAMGLV